MIPWTKQKVRGSFLGETCDKYSNFSLELLAKYWKFPFQNDKGTVFGTIKGFQYTQDLCDSRGTTDEYFKTIQTLQWRRPMFLC